MGKSGIERKHFVFIFNIDYTRIFFPSYFGRSPVITSSPSEDHTYSAGGGGSAAGSGASTPLINGNSSLVLNGNGQTSHQGCADNQSNCASSDAAYESSEEW